ncbi:MAG: hypothetical protein WA549_01900 [Thermoplasmata archaeon]
MTIKAPPTGGQLCFQVNNSSTQTALDGATIKISKLKAPAGTLYVSQNGTYTTKTSGTICVKYPNCKSGVQIYQKYEVSKTGFTSVSSTYNGPCGATPFTIAVNLVPMTTTPPPPPPPPPTENYDWIYILAIIAAIVVVVLVLSHYK